MTDSMRLTPAEVAQVEAMLDAHPSTRWAMRNIVGKYAGDVWQCQVPETFAEYEAFRLTLGAPDDFEVVQLDDNGNVIEP